MLRQINATQQEIVNGTAKQKLIYKTRRAQEPTLSIPSIYAETDADVIGDRELQTAFQPQTTVRAALIKFKDFFRTRFCDQKTQDKALTMCLPSEHQELWSRLKQNQGFNPAVQHLFSRFLQNRPAYEVHHELMNLKWDLKDTIHEVLGKWDDLYSEKAAIAMLDMDEQSKEMAKQDIIMRLLPTKWQTKLFQIQIQHQEEGKILNSAAMIQKINSWHLVQKNDKLALPSSDYISINNVNIVEDDIGEEDEIEEDADWESIAVNAVHARFGDRGRSRTPSMSASTIRSKQREASASRRMQSKDQIRDKLRQAFGAQNSSKERFSSKNDNSGKSQKSGYDKKRNSDGSSRESSQSRSRSRSTTRMKYFSRPSSVEGKGSTKYPEVYLPSTSRGYNLKANPGRFKKGGRYQSYAVIRADGPIISMTSGSSNPNYNKSN